jgi:hypothetical protein
MYVVLGVLIELVKDILTRRRPAQVPTVQDVAKSPFANKVLNVGGGSKATPIPGYFFRLAARPFGH